MLHSKSFVKRTKKGSVVKVVREHYLRDDISCGSLICKSVTCNKDDAILNSNANNFIIIDTNIALHQIDLLENSNVCDVILLSIVLEEVKNKNLSIYNRLRAICGNNAKRFFVFSNEHHKETYIKTNPGETPNDRNDRAIRVACKWYNNHLNDKMNILLLTNDKENLLKAKSEGLNAMSVRAYVESLNKPELLDIIAYSMSEDKDDGNNDVVMDENVHDNEMQKKKKSVVYSEHKPMSEITLGLQKGILHQGKLRVNRYNCFEAYVGSESIGNEILINGRSHLNRSIDGDIVAVEILPQEEWKEISAVKLYDNEEEDEEPIGLPPGCADDAPSVKNSNFSRPTGRVVGIIKRNWRLYCGSIEHSSFSSGQTVNALFVSTDRRIPKIRIQTRQIQNLIDKRIIVAIDSWDRSSFYPNGHYVRTLGVIGDRDTESEVLLLENDINTRPFSENVLKCLPPLPWKFSENEFSKNKNRKDLRAIPCFSVDPIGCKDIDDALHCLQLPNGNYELGVHIADVTNFVLPDTPLDEEASKRGTSVYLVEKRIDMLPKPLTEDICSLRADVERLAFSILWEMTPDAEILKTEFTKSVIKSIAALSYVEAQARMDDSRMNDPLTQYLRNMNNLAKIMRKKRIEKGALTLASPEVKFEIDTETHDPLDVGMYQVREANHMVEEFMLAANISVSQKILSHFPLYSLLRRHPIPTPKMFEPIKKIVTALNLNLDFSTSLSLANSLDLAVGEDPYFNKLIRILTTRCMTQAVYFVSGELTYPEFHHYGLAAPIYTHFTSPIRRYADVIVHRLLSASLGLNSLPSQMHNKSAMTSISDNLNYRHRNAQMASRASVELHTLIFFKNKPTDAEARITMIRPNGLIVFIPKFGIEGPVFFTEKNVQDKQNKVKHVKVNEDKEKSDWVVDEESQTITSVVKSKSFKILDKVNVHIEVTEPQPNRPKLTLTLLI